jgi:hypothetical protein
MPIVQGIIDASGNIVRNKGRFKVLSKAGGVVRIQVTGQKTARAFVQAIAWREDGDIESGTVTASPDPKVATVMMFRVDDRHGLSFRIEP